MSGTRAAPAFSAGAPLLTFFDASGRVAHGALIGCLPTPGWGSWDRRCAFSALTQEIEALERALADKWEAAVNLRKDLQETETQPGYRLREERDGASRAGNARRANWPRRQMQFEDSANEREQLEAQAAKTAADRDALASVLENPAGACQGAMEFEERTRQDLQAAPGRGRSGRRRGARPGGRLGEESAAFQRKVFAWERLRDEERRQTETLAAVRERHLRLVRRGRRPCGDRSRGSSARKRDPGGAGGMGCGRS